MVRKGIILQLWESQFVVNKTFINPVKFFLFHCICKKKNNNNNNDIVCNFESPEDGNKTFSESLIKE